MTYVYIRYRVWNAAVVALTQRRQGPRGVRPRDAPRVQRAVRARHARPASVARDAAHRGACAQRTLSVTATLATEGDTKGTGGHRGRRGERSPLLTGPNVLMVTTILQINYNVMTYISQNTADRGGHWGAGGRG